MRWILTSLVTLGIGIVVLAACQGNVFSLKVGDCYNGPSFKVGESTEVENVKLVSCDEPHESEVYAVFELPDSSWKGEDYVAEQAWLGCKPRFEAFVGIEYGLSTLHLDYLYPSERTWNEVDDRLVQCSIRQESYMKVSGSAKGSKR